jgi:transposase InsO family protein
VLVHKLGKENGIADPLSCPSRFQVTDAEDNRDQLVLNPERFITLAASAFAKPPALEQKIQDCSDREVEVAQALEVLRKKGPRRLVNNLLEWEELDGLLYYKGKLYIPNNKELHAEIIKTCHDTPTTGHPGKHGMLELVSRHYWWPKMGASVEQYVLGCDKCQRYKPAQHPNSTLQPHEMPAALWEHVGVNFITQLPGSNRFDSICIYVDHYSDQCHLVPCKSNLTAEGAADIHYSDVFRLHGIPKKIFSDRGPQFAARFMRALYKRLGIETGFTTAYHSQGNSKVERKNQEVEQYLCLFCNKRQDDWASHLPAAEFALNSHLHSGASQTPFEIIYGYQPDFTVPIGKQSNMPSLDERLDRLANVRKEAKAALRLSKERMKEQFEQNKRSAHVFNIGDMVWLTAKDIKIHQKTPKLGPRQLGPYKVLERIGDLDYRLELPSYLNLNPVFHVSRLSPWHDNGLHKPPPPEPVVVQGEEEYEVDSIIDSRVYRHQLQYLVCWKGYGEGENTWEPAKNLSHAKKAIAKFHKENPAAPCSISAALFDELRLLFRAPDTWTDPDLFPDLADLSWELGKYIGLDASQGRSGLEGG